MNIPDNYDQWLSHEADQERRLAKRPECADCGNPIQHEECYLINDELICPDCLESGYRKNTEDFIF